MWTSKIKCNQVKYRIFITINKYGIIFENFGCKFVPLTNAIEALKSEFLADPGKTWPEFADSCLSRAWEGHNSTVYIIIYNHNVMSWTTIYSEAFEMTVRKRYKISFWYIMVILTVNDLLIEWLLFKVI